MKTRCIPWDREGLMVLNMMARFNRELRICRHEGDLEMSREISSMITDEKKLLSEEGYAIIVHRKGKINQLLAYNVNTLSSLSSIPDYNWFPANFAGIRSYRSFLNGNAPLPGSIKYLPGLLLAWTRIFLHRIIGRKSNIPLKKPFHIHEEIEEFLKIQDNFIHPPVQRCRI